MKSTKASNPFATVCDLQNFVATLAFGDPDDIWQTLPGINPYLGEPLAAITGAGRYRYAKKNRFGLVGRVTQGFVTTAVPQIRLEEALRGNLYQGTPQHPTLTDRAAMDELLRYMGIPYARVSRRRIQELSER